MGCLWHCNHWKRRIKSVAVTIPAIVGPCTTVACTLKLLNSTIRTVAGGPDEPVNIPSDYIATSHAQSDSGDFQFNFTDERYLPFEGHGVRSEWELKLPENSIAQFDYSTITDVILSINYTSHYDESRRADVVSTLNTANFGISDDAFFTQLLSLKTTFPDLWTVAISGASENESEYSFELQQEHFPYLIASKGISITNVS